MDLVIAYKCDFDEDGTREIDWDELHAILQMVVASDH